MNLRKFWKAMRWWSKGRRKHPFYKHISLNNISEVEYILKQKHERTINKWKRLKESM